MATSGDLTVALLIKADVAQARAELALTQAQLKGVEDAAKAGGVGFANYSASLKDISAAQQTAAAVAAESADALGNVAQAYTDIGAAMENGATTAANVETRFAAVMERERASAEAKQASEAQASARRRAETQARQMEALAARKAALADAESAEAKAAAAAAQTVATQNAATQAYHASRASLMQLSAALERTSITTEESEALEASLTAAHARGAITDAEFAEAVNALANAKIKDAAATEAQTVAQKAANASAVGGKMNSRMAYSLSALIDDAASGQLGRSKRELAALANESGLLTKLMSPMGLAIGGVVAMLGALAVAFAKGVEETEKFRQAIVSTGASGTVTAGQLVDMADQVGASTGSYGNAQEALLSFANSGKYTATQLQGLTQTAVEFAAMTGGKVADGVKFVDGVMSGHLGTLMKLDEQYHFLSASQYAEIQRLIDQGQQDQATAMAQRAASDAVHDRAEEVRKNAGIMVRAWDSVTEHASKAWAAMKDVGATHSIGQQWQDAKAELAKAKGTHLDRAGNEVQNASPEAIAALQNQVNQLGAQMVAQSFAQTRKQADELADRKGKQALSDLDRYKTPTEKFQDATKKAKAELDAVMLGHFTDAEIATAKQHYQVALEQAQKAYDSATKTHGAKGPNIGRTQLTADVSAVQDQLRTLANAWQNTQHVLDAQHRAGKLSDKDYFAALRKDLDDYTKARLAALEQEKKVATAHIATQADRIRADQKVASIDAQITQTRQSAEAKRQEINDQEQKSVEQLARAWEKLQAEIGKADGAVDFGALAQKLATAKAALGAGLTDQQGYQNTKDALIDQTVAGNGAPRYQGLSPRIGGANADEQRAQRAAQKENTYFQQEIVRLTAFYDQKLLTTQKYDAKLETLVQDHQKRLSDIQNAEQMARLVGLTGSFNEVAKETAAAFGAQSHAAKIAFDLSKASSIAESMLAIHTAAAKVNAQLPWPESIVAEASILAQGLAIVADIRAISMEGFSAGGYTGDGGRYQVAGVVHAGEGVLSAPEVSALGGEAGFNALRTSLRNGFAEGGYVHPFMGAPTPAQLGFAAPSTARMDIGKLAAANESRAKAPAIGVRIVNQTDPQMTYDAMNSPDGETVIVNTIARNATKVRQMIGGG